MLKFAGAALVALLIATAVPVTVHAQTATTTQDATKKDAKAKPEKKPVSAGMAAMHERQKKCGAEWKEAKAAGKTQGQTWPKFWSACNKRLKGAT